MTAINSNTMSIYPRFWRRQGGIVFWTIVCPIVVWAAIITGPIYHLSKDEWIEHSGFRKMLIFIASPIAHLVLWNYWVTPAIYRYFDINF
jgi:polyferredoxin